MARAIDNVIAYRVLSMLVKPFVDTDAYKLGIIDAKGKNLIKPSHFTTEEQKDAYTYLHRLVFNMKKIINKLPGGENKLKSLIAALFLIKESNQRDYSLVQLEELYKRIMESTVVLAEESIIVEKFLEEDGMGAGAVGGAPTNSTAGVAGTTIASGGPVVKKKDIKKYKQEAIGGSPIAGLTRRPRPL